jgi:hypothetical protein
VLGGSRQSAVCLVDEVEIARPNNVESHGGAKPQQFRVHKDEHVDPARPATAQRDPEPAVHWGDAGTAAAVYQHRQLLTESEILQDQVSAGPSECSDDNTQQQQQGTNHERPTVYAVVSKTSILFP